MLKDRLLTAGNKGPGTGSHELHPDADQEKADEEAEEQAALREAARRAEPSIFFTVCACLTLVLMLYVVYAMSAQFFNQWSEKSIPVFGFEQIGRK